MLLINNIFKNVCRTKSRHFGKIISIQSHKVLSDRLCPQKSILTTDWTRLSIKRCYSDQSKDQKETPIRLPKLTDDEIVVMPSFFKALKSSYYLHAIFRAKLDPEFSMEEFVDASKQAIEVVTHYLSSENYEALEGLLSSNAIQKLRHSISRLSPQQKKLIPLIKEDIYGYFPYQINASYAGEKGSERSFAEVTSVFYALKGLDEIQKKGGMPPLTMGLMPEYQENIYVCNAQFRRDYTEGDDSPWVITMFNEVALITL